MKKLVLSIVMALAAGLVTSHHLSAASIFKAEPKGDAEQAVSKVLEALATRHGVGDGRGVSELYTEDGVYNYFFGTRNEPKSAQGRTSIHAVYSFATVTGVKYHDMVVTKVQDDKAEATGSYVLRATAFGTNFLRTADRTWKLRREPDGLWRIYRDDTLNAAMRQE